MCDPLGKNLLLPSWFAEDFEEESSTSSLGIFFFVLDSLGKNVLLPCLGLLNVLESIGKEFSAFSMGMMLDMV